MARRYDTSKRTKSAMKALMHLHGAWGLLREALASAGVGTRNLAKAQKHVLAAEEEIYAFSKNTAAGRRTSRRPR